ncbi:MAG: hypothetical protein BGP04_13345 [Rhizobiales bacterium 62-17]|nr:hypothetical protein [Hyphomicrobiales bacterium]OJY02284.1 MAG: hypothetical protein BGP04_13345 [Rhizobiales bacterium 62-17]
MKSILFSGMALFFTAASAIAQAPGTYNAVGTIERLDSASLAVKTDANTETFALAPSLVVLQNKVATLNDIKPNDFVASAAVVKDGKLHSTELRIFPEALRGLGEGQRPMSGASAGQTMTNATVTGAVLANGSNTLKVRFPGGDSELVLDPGVPVTRIDQVERSMLKPVSRSAFRPCAMATAWWRTA